MNVDQWVGLERRKLKIDKLAIINIKKITLNWFGVIFSFYNDSYLLIGPYPLNKNCLNKYNKKRLDMKFNSNT